MTLSWVIMHSWPALLRTHHSIVSALNPPSFIVSAPQGHKSDSKNLKHGWKRQYLLWLTFEERDCPAADLGIWVARLTMISWPLRLTRITVHWICTISYYTMHILHRNWSRGYALASFTKHWYLFCKDWSNFNEFILVARGPVNQRAMRIHQ